MTFGSQERVYRVCGVVNAGIMMQGGRTRQLTLFAVPLICEPLTCQSITFCENKSKHLAGLPLADPSHCWDHLEIDILIGSDQHWSFLTGKTRHGESGPVGVHTELGWVLSGTVGVPTRQQGQTTLISHTLYVDNVPQHEMQSVDESLKSFWDLESIGITDPDRT